MQGRRRHGAAILPDGPSRHAGLPRGFGRNLLRILRTTYRITASQTGRPASAEGSKVSPPTRTEVLSR
jgi:hypothetical protein